MSRSFRTSVLCLLAIGLTWVMVNRVGDPRPSTAGDFTSDLERPVLLRLMGRDHTLVVHSGPTGPLFSLQDDHGRILFRDLTAEDFAQQYPELYERALAAGVSGESTAHPALGIVDIEP
jgi:hypothetical protein